MCRDAITMPLRALCRRRLWISLLPTLAACATFALSPGQARAAGNSANAGLPGASPTDPLAGIKWGVYRGVLDGLYPAFEAAHGHDRQLLAKEALAPLMYWFGSWNQDALAASTAQHYIRAVQHGNPNALVQMAIFRLAPWERAACKALPTAQQVAGYRDWVSNWAQGIGGARVAMDLQPDLPFESCVPGHSQVPAQEVSYAAQTFAALAHTTVYIDAGAGDWQSVSGIASMLRESGVQYTRGFALGATHYESTAAELIYGQKLVRALAADGIPGMHFIINTVQNGRPFTTQQHPREFKDQGVCESKRATHCVTLGIRPTAEVAADPAADGLNGHQARIARRLCDGYLWFGRPWLENQAGAFQLSRALQMA
ncbi:MAG: glycoside hydrolase family 6 protein, partial [Solirubrobacteraceae bacterium]